MSKVFDRCHPAPGVKVYGVPGMSAAHLSGAQQRLVRASMIDDKGRIRGDIAYMGVLKMHRLGGPVGLGCLSTAHSASQAINHGDFSKVPEKYNTPIATHGPGVRPGIKRRSPKRGPRNPVFSGKMRTHQQDAQHFFAKAANKLRGLWRAINGRIPDPRLEEIYESKRANFLRLYAEAAVDVIRSIEKGRVCRA